MRQQNQTAAVFDRWAPTYNSCALQPLYRAAHHAVLATACSLELNPRVILDVGCGTGRLLALTGKRFPDATLVGADRSAGMLRTAHDEPRPGRAKVHFVQATVEHLPFTSRTFDLVTSTVSYRHWANPTAALLEIHRVLRPNGVLLLADVLPATPRTLLTRLAGADTLPHPFTKTQLSRTGWQLLDVIRIDGYGPVTHLTLLPLRRTTPDPHQHAAPHTTIICTQQTVPFSQSTLAPARLPWETMR